MSNFTHLHLHTEHSLLDGSTRTAEVAQIAYEKGQLAVGMTDHGTLAGAFTFWKGCKEAGVKPIIGWEAYVTPDKNVREKDTPIWHLIMVAMNETGRNNLFALSQIGWTKGFYKKPRIDYHDLLAHNEGVIVLSACMASETARALQSLPESDLHKLDDDEYGDLDAGAEALKRYKGIFGDRFYVELQPNNPANLNNSLYTLADDLGIKCAVTVDSHYDHCTSKSYEELLLTMQQVSGMKASDKQRADLNYEEAKKKDNLVDRLNVLWPNRGLQFHKHDLYIMSRDEIVERMDDRGHSGDALADTTLEIAERCEGLEFETGNIYLPKAIELPKTTSDEYLRELVLDGLQEKGLHKDQVYLDRVDEELAVLADKGFADYFLIVWDLVNEARKRNIYIGPGRGSAAGSLVAYSLGITKIDPIKYNLLFFRFINAERNDFPDIDLDIEHTRRDELKDYFREKYGEALSIATYSQFKAKGLVRSIGRALAIPLQEVNAVCKHFETLEEYEESDVQAVKGFRNRHPEVLTYARKFEGMISGTGMHAAAVVIADRPFYKLIPIESRVDPEDKKKRVEVTAMDMHDVESLGLIKFDFLGLKNLSIIHDTVDLVKERHGVDIIWDELEPDDPDVLAHLDGGHTTGVFQMESTAYRNLLMAQGVDDFEDMAASNALVRPGAFLTVAQDYIKRKKGEQEVTYPHPDTEEFLKATYGLYIYQEQVMQLAVTLGDFTWAEADKLRKIIGKKRDVAEFQPFYQKWMENASKKIADKAAEKMWHDFEKHAGYSFNRSHAVAYSYVGYVTAYLKHHYPLEYLYALIKHEKNDSMRMHYILEATRMGVDIEAPDVQRSQERMSLDGNTLLFGLSDTKNVGFTASKHLIQLRPFADWNDFAERVEKKKCNKKVLEALTAVDGFRNVIDGPRNTSARDNYMEYLSWPVDLEGVASLGYDFDNLEDCDDDGTHLICGVVKSIKRTETWVRVEFEDITGTLTAFAKLDTDLSSGDVVVALVSDKAVLGHTPVAGLTERIENGKAEGFEKLLAGTMFDDYELLRKRGIGHIGDDKALVVPMYVRKIVTKTGKEMAFVYISDGEGIEKFTCFPRQWSTYKKSVHEWVPICIQLKFMSDGGFTVQDKGLILAEKLQEKYKEKVNA